MIYFLIVLAFLLVAAGIIFSVLPPLPGPILAYGALWCTHFSAIENQISVGWWIFWTLLALGITILDYMLPVMATKKFGGTKAGIYGGIIGTVAGVLLPIPFGIILGPLLGAIIGDLIGGNQWRAALKSGFGSFLGFVTATLAKVLVSIAIGIVVSIKLGSFTISSIFG
ncbi:MAG: DUF456 domain-containing protein [Cyclobacteriaceae bacterium]|nr:DUF456 domain-containing protein [Cyclobacteriaceae bacterium HetDA_MAG_MS6]